MFKSKKLRLFKDIVLISLAIVSTLIMLVFFVISDKNDSFFSGYMIVGFIWWIITVFCGAHGFYDLLSSDD